VSLPRRQWWQRWRELLCLRRHESRYCVTQLPLHHCSSLCSTVILTSSVSACKHHSAALLAMLTAAALLSCRPTTMSNEMISQLYNMCINYNRLIIMSLKTHLQNIDRKWWPLSMTFSNLYAHFSNSLPRNNGTSSISHKHTTSTSCFQYSKISQSDAINDCQLVVGRRQHVRRTSS